MIEQLKIFRKITTMIAKIKRKLARLLGVDVESIQAREQQLMERVENAHSKLNKARDSNKIKTEALRTYAERIDYWKEKATKSGANSDKFRVLQERNEVLKTKLKESRELAKKYASQRDALRTQINNINSK